MANKSKRFNDKSNSTPGPGAYTLSKKGDWIKETGRNAPSDDYQNKKGGLVCMLYKNKNIYGQIIIG